ncbi:unnamed protein product [Merluccius merluccius]
MCTRWVVFKETQGLLHMEVDLHLHVEDLHLHMEVLHLHVEVLQVRTVAPGAARRGRSIRCTDLRRVVPEAGPGGMCIFSI